MSFPARVPFWSVGGCKAGESERRSNRHSRWRERPDDHYGMKARLSHAKEGRATCGRIWADRPFIAEAMRLNAESVEQVVPLLPVG